MSFLDIENRRAIIHRRAIAERLEGLRPGKKIVAEATAILRGALEYGRAEVAKRLDEEPGNGRAAAQATAFLHDQLVRLAHDFVTERVIGESGGELALVPFASEPALHTPLAYVPCDGVAETNVVPAGRLSVISTPVASFGPLLLAVTV